MRMDREKILNTVGFLLLAGCFAYSLIKVTTRTARENDESVTTIRFAHWQLESGIREALDAIADEYVKLHPNVRIEQILIPERTYPTWLTTRLVGGNPPDLVSIGTSHGMTEERMARYFTPLTAEVEKPNPYNVGTDLEGVAWRDTFIDGLSAAPGIQNLFDYYGVPSALITIRVFYNKALYEKITGRTEPPKSYDDLKLVFQAVHDYNAKNNAKVIAMAGSQYNAPILMDNMFNMQTQKLMLKIDRNRVLKAPAPSIPMISYFEGAFDIDDPAILAALEFNRKIGKEMPQGFIQLAREDAAFNFVQQNTLMIATGSWDVTSIRRESPFEVGVFPIPMPTRNDPEFGAYIMGPSAEAETWTSLNFGLARDSNHPEVALDFLKFITSKKSNTLFTQTSKWLPSVAGVPLPEEVKAFAPITEGYPNGFNLKSSGGAEVTRIHGNAFYKLVRPDGGVKAFMDYFAPLYPQAMIQDAKTQMKTALRNISRQDTTFAALRYLADQGDTRAGEKAATLQEVQSTLELEYYQRRMAVWKFENNRKKN